MTDETEWISGEIEQLCQSRWIYRDALEMQPLFKQIARQIVGTSESLMVQLNTYENDSVEVRVSGKTISCDYCMSSGDLCVHGGMFLFDIWEYFLSIGCDLPSRSAYVKY